MSQRPGKNRQHLLLTPTSRTARSQRRRLYTELTDLGWERQTPVFAVAYAGNCGRWRGIEVREQIDFGTRRVARTPHGERVLSLRTVGTNFTLVTGERLRRGGLDQLAYSFGYALDGEQTRGDVLLADGWVRAATAAFGDFFALIERRFTHIRVDVVEPAASLRRLRCCAWGLHDAT